MGGEYPFLWAFRRWYPMLISISLFLWLHRDDLLLNQRTLYPTWGHIPPIESLFFLGQPHFNTKCFKGSIMPSWSCLSSYLLCFVLFVCLFVFLSPFLTSTLTAQCWHLAGAPTTELSTYPSSLEPPGGRVSSHCTRLTAGAQQVLRNHLSDKWLLYSKGPLLVAGQNHGH